MNGCFAPCKLTTMSKLLLFCLLCLGALGTAAPTTGCRAKKTNSSTHTLRARVPLDLWK